MALRPLYLGYRNFWSAYSAQLTLVQFDLLEISRKSLCEDSIRIHLEGGWLYLYGIHTHVDCLVFYGRICTIITDTEHKETARIILL